MSMVLASMTSSGRSFQSLVVLPNVFATRENGLDRKVWSAAGTAERQLGRLQQSSLRLCEGQRFGLSVLSFSVYMWCFLAAR